jgi:hypothetical protein
MALAATQVQPGSPRLYSAPFNESIQQYQAMMPLEAARRAKPAPQLRPWLEEVNGAFSADPRVPTALGSVRLAVSAGGGWLYVDKHGFARRNGEPGRFDVVGFERLVRRERRRLRIWPSPLVALRVTNRSGGTLTLVDASGKPVARVPPREKTATLTWFCRHKAFVDGVLVGTTDSVLARVDHAEGGGRLQVRLGAPALRTADRHTRAILSEPEDRLVTLEVR